MHWLFQTIIGGSWHLRTKRPLRGTRVGRVRLGRAMVGSFTTEARPPGWPG